MARPTFPRNVGVLPGITYFKPAGVRTVELEEVVLGHDEIEAMRLKHLVGLSREEAVDEHLPAHLSSAPFFRLRERQDVRVGPQGGTQRWQGTYSSIKEAS